MGLLDLKTDLKSLKFGNPPASDRPGSGNSNQPYIKDPIDASVAPQNEDFLLRGGLNAPLDAANDVIRLTKMFGDLKSPSGILFVAKQNLLSRIAVNTQASGKGVNEGVYTPLTTLAQAGVGFAGGHLSKQGLNPLSGVKTYGPKSLFNPQGSTVIGDVIGNTDGTGNRLVDLYNTQIPNTSNDFSIEDQVNVYSYPGGPGSKLGIGKTNIRFATDNMGAPLLSGIATKDYQAGIGKSGTDRSVLPPFYSPLTNNGVTNIFKKKFHPESIEIGLNNGTDGKFGRTFKTSVYSRFDVNDNSTILLQSTDRIYDNGALTWDQEKIEEQVSPNNSKNVADPTIQDFRAPLLEDKKPSTIMGIAPNYSTALNTIDGKSDSRINYRSPGQKGNIISYTQGKLDLVTGQPIGAVDKINAQPIYKSKNVKQTDVAKNDLVKFRIGAVLRDGEKVFMHFRAFIDQFSDSYSAKWSGIQYMGRGEELYKYGGFGRKITLSYTVAAQSKPELMAQYKKLNFLASTLAPDYGRSGYMGGVLTTLTLGGWCYELPGFIDSLTLDIPQESPWEIAIDDSLEGGKGSGDPTVKEMPHICKVTMNFTPIHTFRPELQDNRYDKNTGYVESKFDANGELSKKGYGNQRFLALTNGNSENYNNTFRKKVGEDEDGRSITERRRIGD